VRRFAGRRDAGRVLAGELVRERPELTGRDDAVVLGLARGGVPVAAGVAAALSIPLDVLVVRKIGLPSQPELAMGALAESGGGVEVVRNEAVISRMAVPATVFEDVCTRETAVLRARAAAYRSGRAAFPLRGKLVLVVDDGLATGSSMRAAIAAVRAQQAREVVVAVPVGAADTCTQMRAAADAVVCAWTPEPFYAVGQAYKNFDATRDDEVVAALAVPTVQRTRAPG
jgi:putative phosphoribosyl transferase